MAKQYVRIIKHTPVAPSVYDLQRKQVGLGNGVNSVFLWRCPRVLRAGGGGEVMALPVRLPPSLCSSGTSHHSASAADVVVVERLVAPEDAKKKQ